MNFKKHKPKRLSPSISAGSMADIAFLLLIFFLVTTTIVQDKGILVKLPQWVPDPVSTEMNKDNVLSILVNGENELLVEDKVTLLGHLKEGIVEFITNPYGRDDLPSDPRKAIISLQNHDDTEYETYISVYSEIKSAYNQIWNLESKKRYQRSWKQLTKAQKKDIRSDFPQVISEAE